MPGASSGGILRYSIVIEAIDKATGRLDAVAKMAQRTRDALAFPSTGASTHLKNQVSLYSELTQQTSKYSQELDNLMRKQGKGFMADVYKAQQSDAQNSLRTIEDNMNKMGSMFRDVNQKNLAEHSNLIKGMRESSRGMSKYYFDEKGWKSSEPKRKAMKAEVTRFFEEIQKSPWTEKGGMASIVDRWQQQMEKMSKPTQKILSKAFERRFGMKMETLTGMSQTDRAVVMHYKQLAQLKTEVEQSASAYEGLNKRLDQTKARLKAMSILFFQSAQFIQQAMVGTRPIAEAMAFSGQNLEGRTPFSFTNMGATVTDMGNIYRAAARSPYESEMLANQFAITNYTNLFDTKPQQFVPMLTGMKTLFGSDMSMSQQISSLTGLQMKSNMDLGGFFSMYMMGAIPQLSSMGNNMNETLALIGAVSNQGLGSFAGRHVGTALQSLMNPAKKSQDFQAMYGFDFQKIVQENSILDALQMINVELDKLTDKERAKAMAEMFPGRGQGPMEIMLKSVEQAKRMNRELGSMLESARGIEKASQHGYFRIQQMSSALSNVPTGMLYGFAETSAFKGTIRTITDAATEINRWNDKMAQDGPGIGGELLGGAGSLATFLVPALLGRSAMNMLPQYMGAGRVLAQNTQMQNAMMYGNMGEVSRLQGQYAKQQQMSQAGGVGGWWHRSKGGIGAGAARVAGNAMIVSAIYFTLKSFANAAEEYYKKRNREEFVDPIVRLSIADIEGAKKGEEEALRDLRVALIEARRAIDMNTSEYKKANKGARYMSDYSLEQRILNIGEEI